MLYTHLGIAIGIAISELSGINIPHSATQTTLGMGHVITEAAEVSTQHHIVISILQGKFLHDSKLSATQIRSKSDVLRFTSNMRVIIFLGLAAGTILYIVVFEVLLREKSKRVPGLLQFLFIVLGFTIMLLVEIYGKRYHIYIYIYIHILTTKYTFGDYH